MLLCCCHPKIFYFYWNWDFSHCTRWCTKKNRKCRILELFLTIISAKGITMAGFLKLCSKTTRPILQNVNKNHFWLKWYWRHQNFILKLIDLHQSDLCWRRSHHLWTKFGDFCLGDKENIIKFNLVMRKIL